MPTPTTKKAMIIIEMDPYEAKVTNALKSLLRQTNVMTKYKTIET